MVFKIKTIFNSALIFYIYLILSPVKSGPLPKPDPEPSPNPQLQFPARSSYSSQQFTMYKPIQVGYSSPGGTGGFRQDFAGNPINPVFHYNYNISHPPQGFGEPQGFGQSPGLFRGPGQASSGAVLSPQQVQFLRQEQQRRGGLNGQLQLQQGQPLQSQYQRQYQKNQVYAPIIIANPNVIANPTNLQQQGGFQNVITSRQGQANPEQLLVDDYTEPETEGIGFRINADRNRIGKARTSSGGESGSNIVFDPRIPGPQAFQFPSDNIIFSGQNRNQFSGQGQGQPQTYNSFNTGGTTTRPPIQIPYLTTPSALKKLQQLQKNSQQTVSGFRSSLGLVNPTSLQASSLAELSRHSALNLSPALRSARVQNIVVPVNTVAQTPAGTRLLQNNLNSLQNLQNAIARNVYVHQNSGPGVLHPSQFSSGIDLSSPNLHILKGLAITPENQKDVGQLFFANPQNPALPPGSGNGAVLASSAQKVFILPQGSGIGTTDSENSINFNNDEQSPAEIVVTVVDDDSSGDEKGKVLSNFSLFLMPSSYKKCVEGYKRAHDGKCRLIIKLRGRSRVYSG